MSRRFEKLGSFFHRARRALRAVAAGVAAVVSLACAGVPAAPAPPDLPPRPALPRRAPAPERPTDPIVALVEAARQRECKGELCQVLAIAGPPTQDAAGLRVGLALPCRDPGRAGMGSALRDALRGDWSGAELAGFSLVDGRLKVFALRPEDAHERAIVDGLKAELVACLGRRRCRIEPPEVVLSALRHPRKVAREVVYDAEGHLVARREGELEWHLARSLASGGWLVVTEHRDDSWCEWLEVFPDEPLAPE